MPPGPFAFSPRATEYSPLPGTMNATSPLSVSTVRSADCACAVASRPFLSSSATRSKPANAAPKNPARWRNARRDTPPAFASAPATRCMRGKLRDRRGQCATCVREDSEDPCVSRPRCYIASPLGFSEAGRYYYSEVYLQALARVIDPVDPWSLTTAEEVAAEHARGEAREF